MNVRFLDGRSSVEHLATLAIGPSGLTVHYVGTDGSLEEAFWPADQLQPTHVHEGRPVNLTCAGRDGLIQFNTPADFALVKAAFPYKRLVVGSPATGQFSSDSTAGRILMLSALGVILAAVIAFFVVDSVGGLIALIAPKSWDEKAGRALYASLKSQGRLQEDTAASRIANRFFAETGYTASFPIELHVHTTEEVNAFALPGGPIVLNQGLIEKAATPEELAGVLAHELGHVEERHTFQHMARMGLMYTAISALIGDVSGIVAVIVDNGEAIFGLTYSRRMETSADQFAVSQMLKAHLDPNGMVRFFEILKKEEKARGLDENDFAMLRTHPGTADRIEAIRKLIPKTPKVDAARQQRLAATLAELKAALPAAKEPDDEADHQRDDDEGGVETGLENPRDSVARSKDSADQNGEQW